MSRGWIFLSLNSNVIMGTYTLLRGLTDSIIGNIIGNFIPIKLHVGFVSNLLTLSVYDIVNGDLKSLMLSLLYFASVSLILQTLLPLNTIATLAFIANALSAGVGPMSTVCYLYYTQDNSYINVSMFLFGGLKFSIWFVYGVVESALPIVFS